MATPLAAYIRVPLSWYHSTTYAHFPDETHALIRRVYTHPSQSHSKRHFCGYCGTPLSYWSEEPHTEAEFINLTLGSLVREDLRDLEDMGLIDEEETELSSDSNVAQSDTEGINPTALRQSFGVPWFDSLVEGTRLGRMTRSRGIQRSTDGGEVTIDWEIVEFDGDGGGHDVEMASEGASTPAKRKLQDREEEDAHVQEEQSRQ